MQENGADDHVETEQVVEDDRRTIRGDDGEPKLTADQTAEEKAKAPSIPSTPVTAVIK